MSKLISLTCKMTEYSTLLTAAICVIAPLQAFAAGKSNEEGSVPSRPGRYIYEQAIYAPGGEFAASTNGVPFENAQQCNRHVTVEILRARARVLTRGMVTSYHGKSVLLGTDNSAIWFGCVRYEYYESPEYLRFVNVRMSPQQAARMSRFPEF